MSEQDIEQKEFDSTLLSLSEKTGRLYYHMLNKRRVALTKNHPGLVNISLEERRAILDRARQKAQYGNADPAKMANDWDRFDKRAPTGGAKDD